MRTIDKILILLIVYIFVFAISNNVDAKSVYAITKHTENIIGAYKIIGNQIRLQLLRHPELGQLLPALFQRL